MRPARPEITTPLLFRDMTPVDIPAGLRLCRASRWNQLEEDWLVFLKPGSAGCRVAEKLGEVVGTVAALRYGNRFSWLAMVLVDPRERGSGIGTQLLREGLTILRDENCVRLDATPAGRQIYNRYGFVDEFPLSRVVRKTNANRLLAHSTDVRPIQQQDLANIAAHDLEIFGADRSSLLWNMFHRAPEYALILEKRGRIQGYMMGRPGFLYDQLGPVVAEDEASARHLIASCLSANHGKNFVMDIPRFVPEWIAWLAANEFAEERAFLRMQRGENRYPGSPVRQFAVVGPEFG